MNKKFWSRFFESSLNPNLKWKIQNLKLAGLFAVVVSLVGCVGMAEAQQQAKIPRIARPDKVIK